jgi:hypothetical protein
MNKEEALCAQTDPEMFFPVSMNTVPKDAYAVCAKCPIVEECLDEALSVPRVSDHGVWGGTLPTDRARIRKRPSLRLVYLNRLQEEYSDEGRARKKETRRQKEHARRYPAKEQTRVNSAV